MKYVLGSFVKKREGIETEYKEFCLKHDILKSMNKEDIHRFLVDKEPLPDFNTLIVSNLTCYMNMYIPKYTSSFHNTSGNHIFNLYIGIDDNNEITGIPYMGNLERLYADLNRTIDESLKSHVSQKCCYTWKLKINKCTIDRDVLEDDRVEAQLLMIRKKQLEYKKQYTMFAKKKQEWITELFLYKGKLQNVLDKKRIRKLFILFLKTNGIYVRFKAPLNDPCFVINSSDVKYSKNNTKHIIFWLIKFKDEQTKILMKQKPVEPDVPKIFNTDINMMHTLSKLRTRFINMNVSYYVIDLQFQTKECDVMIKYQNKRGVWKAMTRNHRAQCNEISYS